jgi:hypothetical protein
VSSSAEVIELLGVLAREAHTDQRLNVAQKAGANKLIDP